MLGRSSALTLLLTVLCALSAQGQGNDNSAPGSSTGWQAQMQRTIADMEYHFSTVPEGAVSAPNRAQDLRTTARAGAVSVTPRSPDRDWCLSLNLQRMGRPGRLAAVGAPVVQASRNRLELRRPGIVEWYVNDARGVEQGFTLASSPPHLEGGQNGPVVLEMAVTGGLRGQLSREKKSVTFHDASGSAIVDYAKLKVIDARGKQLAAELALTPGHVQIRFDDTDALYPVIVDPLVTPAAWSFESNQSNAELGFSVSTAGDLNGDGFSDIVVGAHLFDAGENDEGRVFVFHGSPAGPSLVPDFIDDGEQASARYGYFVSAAGDVNGDGFDDLLVGTRYYDFASGDDGAAFLYLGSATGLEPDPSWSVGGGQFDAAFGVALGPAGDVNGDGFGDVIVGASKFDNGETNEGRAFVYHGSPAGLGVVAAWVTEGNQANAFYGRSVGTAGDVDGDGFGDVIVGAPGFDNGQSDEGRAFVYLGSATGLDTIPVWTAESDNDNGLFGQPVGTAGDVNGDGYADVIIGARSFDVGEANEGAAFVYFGSPSGPSLTADWSDEADQAGARFGSSAATAGDVNADGYADIIVGAPEFTTIAGDEGRTFIYLGSSTGPSLEPDWTADGENPGDQLGVAAGTAGDVNGDGLSDVIIGAHRFSGAEASEGKAYVYLGARGGLGDTPAFTIDGDQAGAVFASVIDTAGDVNGDGYSDVIVGTRRFDNGTTDEGAAFLFLGSATGLSFVPDWMAEGNQFNAAFGIDVSPAGDVNGDGFADVIVGAASFDNGQSDEGRAFLYLGSASGLGTDPAWMFESNQSGAALGRYCADAGDVNRDGFADVIIGSPEFSNTLTFEGRAFLFLGSATGLSPTPDWTYDGGLEGARFGRPVAGAGDVNGDGYSDVIVGARRYANPEPNEGRAFVFFGNDSGLSLTPDWTAEGDQQNALFGIAVDGAGDVNGDGFSDILVGADTYTNPEFEEGKVFLYHGSAAGPELTPSWTAEADQVASHFGWNATYAGDINGDGFSDVAIGAYAFDVTEEDEGRVFVYFGSATGLSSTPDLTFDGGQAGAQLGFSLSAAGDVNGDGFHDLALGANSFDDDQVDEGRLFLFTGHIGSGVSRLPRQERTDSSQLIPTLGRSDSETSFGLLARGQSAAGRARVAIEYEVEPLGSGFDGLELRQGPFTDTGPPAAGGSVQDIRALVDGLIPDTFYTWRLRLATADPYFPHTPWVTLPGNGPTEAKITTNPGLLPVDNLVCQGAGSQVDLAWEIGDTYTSIEVSRDATLLATLPGTSTSYTDLAALSGTHQYRITAIQNASQSSGITCDATVVPPAISSLLCTETTGVIQLSWTNNDVYTAVEIRRDAVTIQTLAGNATTTVDATAPDGSHQYDVIPFVGGTGADPVTCVVELPPAAVLDLACVENDGDVELGWQNAGNYDSIEIRRYGVPLASLAGGDTFFADTDPGFGTVEYEVIAKVDAISSAAASCQLDIIPENLYTFTAPARTVFFNPANGIGQFDQPLLLQEAASNEGFPHQIQGFSMSVEHDPSVVSISAVLPGDDLEALNGGGGADFFLTEILPSAMTVGVIVSSTDSDFIVADQPHEVVVIRYDTVSGALVGSSGAYSDISWEDGVGSGLPVSNVVVVGGKGMPTFLIDGGLTLLPALDLFIRGDCNNDATFTISDPIFLLDALFSGGGPAACEDSCDANDGGRIDIGDAIFMLTSQFGGGPTPPLPFPSCGADPTDDALDCASFAGC